MSRRQSAVGDRARRPAAIEPRNLSQAESMVASGLPDVAAAISDLAHGLTNSAVEAIETRAAPRGGAAFETDFQRGAIFDRIARQLIERVEQRPKAKPQEDRTNMPNSAPTLLRAILYCPKTTATVLAESLLGGLE